MAICKFCGYQWAKRVQTPKACPDCKRRFSSYKSTDLKKCEVCERHFQRIELHHKDGNNINDTKDNLIWVCGDCHMAIHNGIKPSVNRTRDYSIENKKVNETMEYLITTLEKGGKNEKESRKNR